MKSEVDKLNSALNRQDIKDYLIENNLYPDDDEHSNDRRVHVLLIWSVNNNNKDRELCGIVLNICTLSFLIYALDIQEFDSFRQYILEISLQKSYDEKYIMPSFYFPTRQDHIKYLSNYICISLRNGDELSTKILDNLVRTIIRLNDVLSNFVPFTYHFATTSQLNVLYVYMRDKLLGDRVDEFFTICSRNNNPNYEIIRKFLENKDENV